MKNILNVIILISISASLHAQTVTPLEDLGEAQEGFYYKDLNNVLDTYEGTYEYAIGNVLFKLRLEKRSNLSYNNVFWIDALQGTYKYVNNNVTVDHLGDDLSSIFPARIKLNSIRQGAPMFCADCATDNWLVGSISDFDANKRAQLFLARRVVNGQPGLQILIYFEFDVNAGYDIFDQITLPSGNFFLRKIN